MPESIFERALKVAKRLEGEGIVKVKRAEAPEGTYYLLKYAAHAGPRHFVEYPELLLARGTTLLVTREGEVKPVTVPFHKFFNIGENVPWRVPETGYRVFMKYDGTLIIVGREPVTGEIVVHTRGMLWTEKNPFAEAFIEWVRRQRLWQDLENLVREGVTLMFELLGKYPASFSVASRITEGLLEKVKPILLAMRRSPTGPVEAPPFGTPFPEAEELRFESLEELRRRVGEWREKEGVVLYYPGQYMEAPGYPPGMLTLMWKVKSPIYLRLVSKGGRDPWEWAVKLAAAGMLDDALAIPMLREHAMLVRRLLDLAMEVAKTGAIRLLLNPEIRREAAIKFGGAAVGLAEALVLKGLKALASRRRVPPRRVAEKAVELLEWLLERAREHQKKEVEVTA